jgi:hypothetical protein
LVLARGDDPPEPPDAGFAGGRVGLLSAWGTFGPRNPLMPDMSR